MIDNLKKSELAEKACGNLYARLEKCDLCPRKCNVNRLEGQKGFCRLASGVKVASVSVHRGEEPPISGTKGSGTIFFSSCNMRCVFCQNHMISQSDSGNALTEEELAEVMLKLQQKGVHNINLVTPSHLVAQITKALAAAYKKGLKLPVVYNSGGYDSEDVLRELEGIVDIYMPDMKYSSSDESSLYSGASDYPEVNKAAVTEMYRQTGNLVLDSDNIAVRGLLIRHLVLPDTVSGTGGILDFVAKNISADAYISLMSQYFPEYKSGEFRRINRGLSDEEYGLAVRCFHDSGLHNGWLQGLDIDPDKFSIKKYLEADNCL
ncbi:MAG: radical SAM protein [Candidatus Aureabacteria bacterium]|nr:radical SAM protein [Candidatus Auribacterota bacterium]